MNRGPRTRNSRHRGIPKGSESQVPSQNTSKRDDNDSTKKQISSAPSACSTFCIADSNGANTTAIASTHNFVGSGTNLLVSSVGAARSNVNLANEKRRHFTRSKNPVQKDLRPNGIKPVSYRVFGPLSLFPSVQIGMIACLTHATNNKLCTA